MTQNNAYINQFANLANAEGRLDAEIYAEAGVKHWSMNEGQNITYQKDDSHTLSLYLNGGEKNYRTDMNHAKGGPGRICLMPQGQDSQWEIKGKVEFVHVYFSDAMLKRYASTSFGIDVRLVELQDLLFRQDLFLQQLINNSFLIGKAMYSYSPLMVEQSLHHLFHYLLKQYNGNKLKSERIVGGLSAYHMKQIREKILDRPEQKYSIEQMASSVDLSPFHFARMFKLSFGESPASFVTKARVDKIKSLLVKNDSLADVSLQTGFCQQSHMTQQFKKVTGYTPAEYRRKSIEGRVSKEEYGKKNLAGRVSTVNPEIQ